MIEFPSFRPTTLPAGAKGSATLEGLLSPERKAGKKRQIVSIVEEVIAH